MQNHQNNKLSKALNEINTEINSVYSKNIKKNQVNHSYMNNNLYSGHYSNYSNYYSQEHNHTSSNTKSTSHSPNNNTSKISSSYNYPSTISRGKETPSSVSNTFEDSRTGKNLETIEEVHLAFVNMIQSSKRLMSIQEKKTIGLLNMTSDNRSTVMKVEEIDLN